MARNSTEWLVAMWSRENPLFPVHRWCDQFVSCKLLPEKLVRSKLDLPMFLLFVTGSTLFIDPLSVSVLFVTASTLFDGITQLEITPLKCIHYGVIFFTRWIP